MQVLGPLIFSKEGQYVFTLPAWRQRFIPEFNSFTPGWWGCNIKLSVFKHISKIHILGITSEVALRWMTQNLTDDLSTLVQVISWCRHVTSHYLNQWWSSSMTWYGVNGPQRVNNTLKTLVTKGSNLSLNSGCPPLKKSFPSNTSTWKISENVKIFVND